MQKVTVSMSFKGLKKKLGLPDDAMFKYVESDNKEERFYFQFYTNSKCGNFNYLISDINEDNDLENITLQEYIEVNN